MIESTDIRLQIQKIIDCLCRGKDLEFMLELKLNRDMALINKQARTSTMSCIASKSFVRIASLMYILVTGETSFC